jgi:tetratricopeptide (TPR) repeat protein
VSQSSFKQARARRRKLFSQEATYVQHRLAFWLESIRRTERSPPTVSRSLIDLQIKPLQKKSQLKNDPATANSAQRLLDDVYANVSFYLPRDFRKAGDYERAALALRLAVEIAPERPRAYWGLAEAYAESGRTEKAFEALRAAIALGRVDIERLETDPSWEALRDQPAWQEILELASSASS